MSGRSEFQRGALWAIELFQKIVQAKDREIRQCADGASQEVGTILNGMMNANQELLGAFQKRFYQEIRKGEDEQH